MVQLSGLDASFLYLETPEQLLHVGAVVLLDPQTVPGGYSYQKMRDQLREYATQIPTFTRKLKHVPLRLDHPYWVQDRYFDIDRHVHRMALPAPGGDAELAELVGHLSGLPLDRARPLWEMWVVEGLASGQVAVVSKMHHAAVDGVSGANLMSYLCSLEPDAPPLQTMPGEEESDSAPGAWGLLAKGVVATATRPFQIVNMVRPTAEIVAGSVTRAREGRAMAAPMTAPRTSFNGNITSHRSVAWANLDLEVIRDVKNQVEGSTVNDVILAISGGALRRYLAERDELPETSLVATVPVSVRESSGRAEGSNKVSSMFTKLGTDIADPLQRLHQLSVSNANAKDHHKAIPADTLQDWAEFAAPRTFGLAMRAVSSLRLGDRGPVIHNLVISNVPGPPLPLYLLGARIDALYPLGPIMHQAGLNITVVSNNGTVHVGAIACLELMPSAWPLVEKFPEELDALVAAVKQQ